MSGKSDCFPRKFHVECIQFAIRSIMAPRSKRTETIDATEFSETFDQNRFLILPGNYLLVVSAASRILFRNHDKYRVFVFRQFNRGPECWQTICEATSSANRRVGRVRVLGKKQQTSADAFFTVWSQVNVYSNVSLNRLAYSICFTGRFSKTTKSFLLTESILLRRLILYSFYYLILSK